MSFVVYKSSAGSGKTFTLVTEYLNLVLQDTSRFSQILAITFTNKAANEMKERIITWLRHLSEQDKYSDSPAVRVVLPVIREKNGLEASEIEQRAGQVLQLILHRYSDFSIGTIDSFIHKIVRTFAHDMDLPVNFEVELENDTLISEAVDLLINSLGKEKDLTDLLLRFAMWKISDEKSWNIDNDLKKFAGSLLTETGQVMLSRLGNLTKKDFTAISAEIRNFRKEFESSLQEMGAEAINTIHLAGLDENDFFYKKSGVYGYFFNLSEGNLSKLQPNSYVLKSVEEDKWTSGKASGSAQAAIDRIRADLLDVFSRIQNYRSEYAQRYVLLGLIYRNLYPVAVLNEINKIIDEIKIVKNRVHISEFNRRIASIVLNEPIPFIYERLGEKYKFFLIDEFQDTSVLQWQNLLPLVENALSESKYSLIVGDGKQAIYRWRNGEVEQFARLPEIYPPTDNPVIAARGESLKRNYSEAVLEKNYRSDNVIIDFNNSVFSELKNLLNEEYRIIYKEVKQQAVKEKNEGYVGLSFYHKNEHEENFNDYNLRKIYEYVVEMIDEGFSFKDIAIICRSNREASQTAVHLIENEVPVVSSQSLLLANSEKVNFIIFVLRWLINPGDLIAKAGVIKWLNRDDNQNLDRQLRQLTSAKKESDADVSFLNILKEAGFKVNPSHLKTLSMYDLAEKIIRSFNLNEKSDPFLQFFLDFVYDFMTEENTSLNDFMEHWDKKKSGLSIILPENLEAVRILTIHKSKGLEFPVVIFPFADQKLKATQTNIWVESEKEFAGNLSSTFIPACKEMLDTEFSDLYEEEIGKSKLDLINLLYVVMTRPTLRLYVISAAPPKNIGEYDSVPKIFHYYLSTKGIYEEGQELYEFGQKIPPDATIIKPFLKSIESDRMISNDWHDRMILSLTAPEYWDVEDPSLHTEWGKLVHRIMSAIDYKEDASKVIENFRLQALIDNEQLEKLQQNIQQILAHETIGHLYSREYRIRKECEIMDAQGHSWRPDRVVMKAEQAWVIDYKTGQTDKKHFDQVNQYASLLKEAGFSDVKSYLIYINDEPEVIQA